MTRRHETLIPLTHDHHHALAQARRLQDVANLTDQAQRRTLANDFINFYFGRAVRHFHEEEELFFAPLIDEPQARDLVLRAVSDHLRLHALVRTIKRQLSDGEADQQILGQISKLLTEHVRFEEQELFPLVEQLVPEDQLRDLATAGRRDV
ncbi:MAG TPA: hemerythrin domain-containing protein [Actinomycetota bacterium]|nr:hemerythrin domain-containing protein [Actinomycetota bacterium]